MLVVHLLGAFLTSNQSSVYPCASVPDLLCPSARYTPSVPLMSVHQTPAWSSVPSIDYHALWSASAPLCQAYSYPAHQQPYAQLNSIHRALGFRFHLRSNTPHAPAPLCYVYSYWPSHILAPAPSAPLYQVYSYWGPRVVKTIYQGLSSSAADMGVGGAAIAAGMMSH